MKKFQDLTIIHPAPVKKRYHFSSPDELKGNKNWALILAFEFLANLILLEHDKKMARLENEPKVITPKPQSQNLFTAEQRASILKLWDKIS